jgi:catechol 2,3-dioxygenase-like lactoylglutathione lyase family enzyme
LEDSVETIIARLLQDFENGKMDRRQLIRSLAVAASAASAIAPAAAAAEEKGFKTIALDHISYQVTDYRKTRDFYAGLMGMKVTNDNGMSQCSLHFEENNSSAHIIARNRRQPAPADAPVKSVIDHIAYKIDNWNTDAVKAELISRGLTARLDTGNGNDGYASFHVKDPDGWDLQISGDPKPGDPLYKKKA